MTRKRIVLLHESTNPSWRWVTNHMPEYDWELVFAPDAAGWKGRLARMRASLRAVWQARDADMLISLDAGLASAVELARGALRMKRPHVTYFFNFDQLPQGARRARQARAYRTVDRFVVSSTIERALYADHFGIDPARIDVVLWGVGSPVASEAVPEGPDYVCAVGGNARDYTLLMRVAAERPAMRFILVVRPANLAGLTVPPNVETLCDIPFADAMAVVKGARMMALPLVATDTPCGHVTIVAAFYLGTPLVVTASTGVGDYVRDGETGLLAAAGSAEAMGAAIDRLWNDPALAQRLGEAGKAFANSHCTEANYPRHVRSMLEESAG